MIRALVCISIIALPTSGAFGQSTEARPTFDIADVHLIRSINPTPEVTGGVLRAGRYELRQATMLDLIAIAWGVDADTVFGGPSWLQWDRFDIVAKAPPDTSREKVRLMLQALLADRFSLVVRRDTKPLPAFALTAAETETSRRFGR